jgi:hypothetical protein
VLDHRHQGGVGGVGVQQLEDRSQSTRGTVLRKETAAMR